MARLIGVSDSRHGDGASTPWPTHGLLRTARPGTGRIWHLSRQEKGWWAHVRTGLRRRGGLVREAPGAHRRLRVVPVRRRAARHQDGKRLVYALSSVNMEKNRYECDLWTLDLASGSSRRLTNSGKEGHFDLLDDGDVLFVSGRGKAQAARRRTPTPASSVTARRRRRSRRCRSRRRPSSSPRTLRRGRICTASPSTAARPSCSPTWLST